MQLLYTCPVPNVEFASLSLLIREDTGSSNRKHNGESNRESKTEETQNCSEYSIELTTVNSPLTTTPPSAASEAVKELHDTVASQWRAEAEGGAPDTSPALSGGNFSFEQCCMEEDARHLDTTAAQWFRPRRCGRGLALSYMAVDEREVVARCLSVFGPSPPWGAASSGVRAAVVVCVGVTGAPHSYGISGAVHSLPGRLAEFVGVMRVGQAHGAGAQWAGEGGRRELERMLAAILLDDEYLRTNAAVQFENGVRSDVSEAAVIVMKGAPASDDAIGGLPLTRKPKSIKLFSSGMLSKKPKKIVFAADRKRRKKHSSRHKDPPPEGSAACTALAALRPSALLSCSLPSSDLAKVISSMHLILSLAERDMPLRLYEARFKRQPAVADQASAHTQIQTYSHFSRSKLNKASKGLTDREAKMFKSPNRAARKPSKVEVGLSGSSDLIGFDYHPTQRTGYPVTSLSSSSSSYTHTATTPSTQASQSSGTTSLTSLESSSTGTSNSIPMISGPSRDSSASKLRFRRDKVAAASAANLYSKSLAASSQVTARSPARRNHHFTGEALLRSAVGTNHNEPADDSSPVIATTTTTTKLLPSKDKNTFDPFSLNEHNDVAVASSDATSTTTSSTDDAKSANINNDDLPSIGQSLASEDTKANAKSLSNQPPTANNQLSHNTNRYPDAYTNTNIDADTHGGHKGATNLISPRNRENTNAHVATPHKSPQTNNALTPPIHSVNIAMNEDLSCSYRSSRLTSCLIEGMIQAQITHSPSVNIPFALNLTDASSHIRTRTLVENNRYVQVISQETTSTDTNTYIDADKDIDTNQAGMLYRYSVTLPKPNHYFPLLKYKCTDHLRPVPIRIETKVRIDKGHCRVALRIMSNPSNEGDLTELTIIMAVPASVHGHTLSTQPPGGVWNQQKGSVIWCVNELGPAQKFQLQAQFDLADDYFDQNHEQDQSMPQFPVLVRCHSMFTQLSDVALDVGRLGDGSPDVTMKLARRFRLSHREKQS